MIKVLCNQAFPQAVLRVLLSRTKYSCETVQGYFIFKPQYHLKKKLNYQW